MKFEWEILFKLISPNEEAARFTSRAKTIGGWIMSDVVVNNVGNASAMVFVADPEHKWEIEIE